MIYGQLFRQHDHGTVVSAGVVGTGQYATAIVTQSRAMARLDVPVVADVDVEAGRQAYIRAGYTADDISIAESAVGAAKAYEAGRRVVVPDATLLVELPVDVVVESTGVPEAGAHHGMLAIEHGKHLVMVSKESDATVGPILKRMADAAGVVYTAADGDQHGLLMGLVDWVRELGLEVVAAGKARDVEFVYDPIAHTVSDGRRVATLGANAHEILGRIRPACGPQTVAARREALGDLERIGGYDLTELAIAANATGLVPDVDELHCPALRTVEIPEVFSPTAAAGILSQRGVIDCVTCLRQEGEAGLGGGVWVVVACENDYSRMILTTKGLIPNASDTTALIYRPYHLCGVETPISLLVAGLLGLPTGASEYTPRVDLVARALIDLRAGDVLTGDHDPRLEYLLLPARAVTQGSPLPLHMASRRPLVRDVAAGTIIRTEMVAAPEDSILWALRAEQDRAFGLPQAFGAAVGGLP